LAAARGRFVFFLDESTIAAPDCIGRLLAACAGNERVALVGSQLVSPDGSVACAGGILWRDGTASWFGSSAGARPHSTLFPRDVDFAAPYALMARTETLRALGGWPEHTGAHDGAIELALRARSRGLSVRYEPSSVAICFDDLASREAALTNGDVARRWHEDISRSFPRDEFLIERAARRAGATRTALLMDSFVPFDDRSAGARRTLAIARILRSLDWHVIFVAHDGGVYEPYTSRARRLGIEVIPHRGDATATLRSLPVPIDLAWIARPDVLSHYLPTLRGAVRAPIVYDTVDLHYVRRRREAELRGNETAWEAMKTIELDLARKAEVTVVTSRSDARELEREGCTSSVVPIVESRAEFRAPYAMRRDLLFLGNYSHEPNVDAVTWLVREIMPLVWERMPDVRLEIAGADPTPAVLRLAQSRVAVTGFVERAERLFDHSRIFVAPIRYGAGMKGKVVYSIARGLPVITTAIGAEGIALRDGESVLLREDARGFADAILELYNDEVRWHAIADAAFAVARDFEEGTVARSVARVLDAALQHKEEIGVDLGLPAHTA
ncbi:MAG: glycosyltransferase, partial [bacterium]|nr:glycosyltransferase [bacterium]